MEKKKKKLNDRTMRMTMTVPQGLRPSRCLWPLFGLVVAATTFLGAAESRDDGLQNAQHRLQISHSVVRSGIGDADNLPSMHLLMTPLFNDSASPPEPIAINVTMTLRAAHGRFSRGKPLVTLALRYVNVPTARYDEQTNPIVAEDIHGNPIGLTYNDEDERLGPRQWFLEEDPESTDSAPTVVLKFKAPPRITDKTTLPGPRVELRRDVSGRGLVGQGAGFVPVPVPVPVPPPPSSSDQDNVLEKDLWNITVEWNTEGSPQGTRGAWSFGDNLTTSAIGTPDDLITHGIFAVGYLQRFPPWDPTASQDTLKYATYWLEPSPYDMLALAASARDIYARIARYFSHSTAPFRIFFRRIEANDGGTGATLSFLLEYCDYSTQYVHPLAMADLLAHETVHEFALLDLETLEAAWYDEGVATYVGVLAGLNGEGDRGLLLRALERQAQAYYTTPVEALEMAYGEVLERYWENVYISRVSYTRGFAFLAQLDGLVWEATGGRQSIDDVIVELYKRRRDGKPTTLAMLKGMLAELVGKEVFDEAYAAFYRGDLIVPAEDCLARHGLKLVRKNWHRFELGFDPGSMRDFKISGLVKGSNADKAGVKEGDVIVEGFMVWIVMDDLNSKMKITVLRDGQEVAIVWQPRSDEVVEAYGWVDVRGGNAEPDEL